MVKKFILNADGLGLSDGLNKGILEGYGDGFLKRASVVVNGECYEDALNRVIPACPELAVGIHLNLTSGKALNCENTTLTNSEQNFKNNFWSLLIRSYGPKNAIFLKEVEEEFRRQIEELRSKTEVTHIDSYEHIHAIPPIFEIVCKLAQVYDIKEVRTHYEKFYIVPDVFKHLNIKYLKNVFKTFILNLFTVFNENILNKYTLLTNDYINGILYDNMTDSLTVSYGVSQKDFSNIIIEAIIHPARYEEGTIDNGFGEYMVTKNKKLQNKIENLGFEITNNYEKES